MCSTLKMYKMLDLDNTKLTLSLAYQIYPSVLLHSPTPGTI